MTKAKRFNKDGIEIEDVGPLKDGERRSFPMSMMDAALVTQLEDKFMPAVDTSQVRHSPGYCVPPMTDAQLVVSEANMAYRKQKLSQAWLTPPPKPAAPPLAKKDEAAAPKPVDTATVTAADVDAAIAARNARLERAWRGAA